MPSRHSTAAEISPCSAEERGSTGQRVLVSGDSVGNPALLGHSSALGGDTPIASAGDTPHGVMQHARSVVGAKYLYREALTTNLLGYSMLQSIHPRGQVRPRLQFVVVVPGSQEAEYNNSSRQRFSQCF